MREQLVGSLLHYKWVRFYEYEDDGGGDGDDGNDSFTVSEFIFIIIIFSSEIMKYFSGVDDPFVGNTTLHNGGFNIVQTKVKLWFYFISKALSVSFCIQLVLYASMHVIYISNPIQHNRSIWSPRMLCCFPSKNKDSTAWTIRILAMTNDMKRKLCKNDQRIHITHQLFFLTEHIFWSLVILFLLLPNFSLSGEEGSQRIQWVSFHFDDNLQWVPPLHLSQCVNVRLM